MNGSFHEGVYKILQAVKSSGFRLGLMLPPHKIASVEPGLRALGVRVIAITPETRPEDVIAADIRGVISDALYLSRFNLSEAEAFFKVMKKNKIVHIPVMTDAEHLPPKTKTKIFKLLSDVKICLNPPEPDKKIKKTGLWQSVKQKIFASKGLKFSVTIRSDYTGDKIISDNRVYKISGAENVIHLIACEPELYASVCAVCAANGFSYEDAALTAAITIRAASKRALSVTNGPGSFIPVFIDALFQIKRDYIYQIKCEEFSNEEIPNDTNFGVNDQLITRNVNENSFFR